MTFNLKRTATYIEVIWLGETLYIKANLGKISLHNKTEILSEVDMQLKYDSDLRIYPRCFKRYRTKLLNNGNKN